MTLKLNFIIQIYDFVKDEVKSFVTVSTWQNKTRSWKKQCLMKIISSKKEYEKGVGEK